MGQGVGEGYSLIRLIFNRIPLNLTSDVYTSSRRPFRGSIHLTVSNGVMSARKCYLTVLGTRKLLKASVLFVIQCCVDNTNWYYDSDHIDILLD
jgi:hypothetical protein